MTKETLRATGDQAAILQQHVASFTDFPPRQVSSGFNPQGTFQAALQAAAQREGN